MYFRFGIQKGLAEIILGKNHNCNEYLGIVSSLVRAADGTHRRFPPDQSNISSYTSRLVRIDHGEYVKGGAYGEKLASLDGRKLAIEAAQRVGYPIPADMKQSIAQEEALLSKSRQHPSEPPPVSTAPAPVAQSQDRGGYGSR